MATYEAFVRSDVYAARQTDEEGAHPEELEYYIVCRDEQGYQFRSLASFTTEDFGHNSNGIAASLAATRRLLIETHLSRGADPRLSEKWIPIPGAYGSAAWDERDELELEAKDLESEAGANEADRFRRDAGLV